jgi:hypothetical protein
MIKTTPNLVRHVRFANGPEACHAPKRASTMPALSEEDVRTLDALATPLRKSWSWDLTLPPVNLSIDAMVEGAKRRCQAESERLASRTASYSEGVKLCLDVAQTLAHKGKPDPNASLSDAAECALHLPPGQREEELARIKNRGAQIAKMRPGPEALFEDVEHWIDNAVASVVDGASEADVSFAANRARRLSADLPDEIRTQARELLESKLTRVKSLKKPARALFAVQLEVQADIAHAERARRRGESMEAARGSLARARERVEALPVPVRTSELAKIDEAEMRVLTTRTDPAEVFESVSNAVAAARHFAPVDEKWKKHHLEVARCYAERLPTPVNDVELERLERLADEM